VDGAEHLADRGRDAGQGRALVDGAEHLADRGLDDGQGLALVDGAGSAGIISTTSATESATSTLPTEGALALNGFFA